MAENRRRQAGRPPSPTASCPTSASRPASSCPWATPASASPGDPELFVRQGPRLRHRRAPPHAARRHDRLRPRWPEGRRPAQRHPSALRSRCTPPSSRTTRRCSPSSHCHPRYATIDERPCRHASSPMCNEGRAARPQAPPRLSPQQAHPHRGGWPGRGHRRRRLPPQPFSEATAPSPQARTSNSPVMNMLHLEEQARMKLVRLLRHGPRPPRHPGGRPRRGPQPAPPSPSSTIFVGGPRHPGRRGAAAEPGATSPTSSPRSWTRGADSPTPGRVIPAEGRNPEGQGSGVACADKTKPAPGRQRGARQGRGRSLVGIGRASDGP